MQFESRKGIFFSYHFLSKLHTMNTVFERYQTYHIKLMRVPIFQALIQVLEI